MIGFLFVFLILSIIHLYTYYYVDRLIKLKKDKCKIKVKAVIIDKITDNYTWYDSSVSLFSGKRLRRTSCFLRYKFYDFSLDKSIEITGKTGVDCSKFRLGDNVDLYFDKDNFKNIYVPSEDEYHIRNVYLQIGTICLVIFFIVLVLELVRLIFGV